MQQLAEHFWNFRGTFKIANVIDIGTHASLVRRSDGRFLMLDSYGFEDEDRRELLRLTDGGSAIEAILNVHPFHTIHCRAAHALAPSARLIGTRRHTEQAPDLPWEKAFIEDAETQAQFASDLEFSVPTGLDLVTADDRVHAASVLVRHKTSKIVHVDDTLNVLAGPGFLRTILPQSRLRFHPMLSKALQPRKEAAADFRRWARDLAESWAETRTVCAAHSAVRQLPPVGWRDELLSALADVEQALDKHSAAFE